MAGERFGGVLTRDTALQLIRRDPYCTSASCASTLVRTLWAGDQVLYEMRAKGGDDATAANLENDGEQGAYYGRVAYTHGAGIDQPLDVIRIGYTLQPTNTSVDYGLGNWGGPYPVIPFTNWHGSIDAATTALGQRMPCQSECTVNLHLPGNEYQMYFAPSKLIARQSWFGSLIESKADGTGQMYMRNRYYNPATGTFTQEDPIGIAGGLNVYGFGQGDPVSYNDSYGLCPERLKQKDGSCPGGMNDAEYDTVQNAISTLVAGPEQNRLLRMLEHGKIVKASNTHYGRPAEADYSHGRINVTDGFFTGTQPSYEMGYNTAGERGWILGHEFGHIVEWESGMLVSEIGKLGTRSNRKFILGLFASQANGENLTLQHDADRMGCMLATQPGIWADKC